VKTSCLTAFIIFFLLLRVGQAFAIGEIFRVEVSGTKYCGDFSSKRFGERSKLALRMQILSDTQIILSYDRVFEPRTTFIMNGSTYLISNSKAIVVIAESFEDGSHAAFQGTLYFDRSQTVIFAKGAFIEKDVLFPDCFSSGKFWTMERLQ
jgi:hypothetical protein